MKRFVFFIDNGKVRNFLVEASEIAKLKLEFGTVYYTKPDAYKALTESKKEKVKPLDASEIEEQNEWARELMTEEDKRIAQLNAREMAYDVNKAQLEFAREVMTEIDRQIARETQRELNYKPEWEQFKYAMWKMGIKGEEFDKRKRAFWARYNKEHRYA